MLKLAGLVLVLLKSWAQAPSIGLLSCLLCVTPKTGRKKGWAEGPGGEDDPKLHIYLLFLLHWAEFDHIATHCRRCLCSAHFLILWKTENWRGN